MKIYICSLAVLAGITLASVPVFAAPRVQTDGKGTTYTETGDGTNTYTVTRAGFTVGTAYDTDRDGKACPTCTETKGVKTLPDGSGDGDKTGGLRR